MGLTNDDLLGLKKYPTMRLNSFSAASLNSTGMFLTAEPCRSGMSSLNCNSRGSSPLIPVHDPWYTMKTLLVAAVVIYSRKSGQAAKNSGDTCFFNCSSYTRSFFASSGSKNAGVMSGKNPSSGMASSSGGVSNAGVLQGSITSVGLVVGYTMRSVACSITIFGAGSISSSTCIMSSCIG